MMKTAGSTLANMLVEHYGRGAHFPLRGEEMKAKPYNPERLLNDYAKTNGKLKLVGGHSIRPYIDYGDLEKDLTWFTFFRKAENRYISHFLFIKFQTNNFSKKRYQSMKSKTIDEWERIENYSNYQTKFIAGEENLQKAIDIVETKMKWVGLTEDLPNGFFSLKEHLAIDGLYIDTQKRNSSEASKEEREMLIKDFGDYITEQNQIDIQLYDYVKKNVYPRYREYDKAKTDADGKAGLVRFVNKIDYQLFRKMTFDETKWDIKNLKKYYKRFYK